MSTVAIDLLGGDDAPAAVLSGALLAVREDPDLRVVLVGPPDLGRRLLAERGAAALLEADRIRLTPASQSVGMGEDPARAVRAKRDASVRVAARLVRDREADAWVSVGSTGAALAAALLTLKRLPGVTRPALALVLPARRGPVVFLDAGANPDCGPGLLAQFALAGAAYASVRLGIAAPRVGLLSIGTEVGKGDLLRREAHALLATLPIRYIGNVESAAVPYGGPADVVVTDGFSGNVLLKGLEAALASVIEVLAEVATNQAGRSAAESDALHALGPALGEAAGSLGPETQGGAILLGVDGVTVIGHGASSPRAVASCLAAAARAHVDGVIPQVAAALADLVGRRGGSRPRDAVAEVAGS